MLYTSDGQQFEGMTQELAQAMLIAAGNSATFITKEAYDAMTAANRAAQGK
jgi:hypothetical protein